MSSRTGFDAENYNRVFVLGAKDCTTEEVRDAFSKYGEVKDVYVVHKHTKGICYVTFAKASEAALAIEEMNGRCLGGSDRHLKVILANSRSEGSVREPQEEDKMRRLFIMVPKSMTEDEINNEFQQYGKIEYVRLIKEKRSDVSRGLAYVKFTRAYDAAVALETCPTHYKPVFASTKPTGGRGDSGSSGRDGGGRDMDYNDKRYTGRLPPPPLVSTGRDYFNDRGGGLMAGGLLSSFAAASNSVLSGGSPDALDQLRQYPNSGETTIEVSVPSVAMKDLIIKLCEIVPGLEYSTFNRDMGFVTARYAMPQLASYARDKLDRFEIIPGSFLNVRLCRDQSSSSMLGGLRRQDGGRGGLATPDIGALFETLQNATAILSQVGAMSRGGGGIGMLADGSSSQDLEDGSYCSVPLPRRCPMLDPNDECVERLFIVSSPDVIPDRVLQDLFCRFGSLIRAQFMPGRKCGYVKYGSKESAAHAIETLHGQRVMGMRLKVMLADPPRNPASLHGDAGVGAAREKRGWTDDDDMQGIKYTRFD